MDRSNPNSKKRKIGDISNANREDEELLFGRRGGNQDDDGDYSHGGAGANYDDENEAMEDDNAVIEGDDEEVQGSDEGEGDDLIENMEA
jgi:hypothetical protein